MAQVFKPPTTPDLSAGQKSVFLAGSIEMGLAVDWQADIESALVDLPIVILNPRRDDWDSSWEQTMEHPQFRQQVEWELDGLERADTVAMYFDPGTKAPVTLMELGLSARSKKVVVCCPRGFWRRGNVEIVCARHDILMTEELPQLIDAVRELVQQ